MNKKYKTIQEVLFELEDYYGEENVPNFSYFTKDDEYIGSSYDDDYELEKLFGVSNWYDVKVIDYKPGYHEWILTLDLSSKDKRVFVESLNNKRRNRLTENLSRKATERRIIDEADLNGDVIEHLNLLYEPQNGIYFYECDLSSSDHGDDTIWVITRPMTNNYHWYTKYEDADDDWYNYTRSNGDSIIIFGE